MENLIKPEVQNSVPVTSRPVAQNNAPASGSYNKPKLTPVFKMLKSAILTWWQNLDKILKIYWEGIKPTLIPMVVVAVLFILKLAVFNEGPAARIFAMLTVIATIVAAVFVAYFWTRAYMGIFILVKKNFTDDAKSSFSETKDLFWPYIGLSLLTALFILCWMLLLIIPGFVFAILYSFAVYAFFFEGQKGMSAIRRSRALAKGYFWAVAGRFLLLMFVSWIFMAILSAPVAGVAEVTTFAKVWNFVIQIISWLVGPIALFFSYNIYSDLVKIKK